jgi:hypothetical protein
LEAGQAALAVLVGCDGRYVEPLGIVDPAARIRDRDDPRAVLLEDRRKVPTDVPEALNGDRRAFDVAPLMLAQRLAHAERGAAPGGLLASDRAADVQRFPGHDAEHRVALVHREGVEDPGHDLGGRADVRGRDVHLRPDVVDDLGRVAAGQSLELRHRELLGVADDTPFGAAEGEFHKCAFPGHPHGKRLRLLEGDRRVVADPALGRAPGDVVGDAVGVEDLDRAVVHADGNGHLERLLALEEHVQHVLPEVDELGDPA